MTSSPEPRAADAQALLDRAGWVRALARRLVRDPEAARDLEQETWLAALRRPPQAGLPLEGWLATVMKNLLRQRVRGEGRRSAREESAPPRAAHHDALLERAESHRALVDAVLALDEPYRTAVLLRFFEGLPARRVAERTGVPLATLKTRLARALERLRIELDARHGGRTAWLSALSALAGPEGWWSAPWSARLPSGPPGLSLGVAVVNTKILLTSLAAVAVAGLAVQMLVTSAPETEARLSLSREPAPVEAVPVELVEARGTRVAIADAPVEPAQEENAAAAVAAPAALESAAGVATATVRGRALDGEGVPLVGVRVAFRDGGGGATTGPGGVFEIALGAEQRNGMLVVDDPGFATVLAGVWSGESRTSESIVVAAPAVELAGTVVDDRGAPLEGALVKAVLPADFRSRFREILDNSEEVPRGAVADERGRFDLGAVPWLFGAELAARAGERLPYDAELPSASCRDLVIVLAAPARTERVIAGTVVAPDGTPVPRARVVLCLDATTSDADGRFRLDLDDPRSANADFAELHLDDSVLVAAAPGYLPGSFSARERDDDGRPLWPEHVVIELGPAPLSIAGRVVDGKGEPVPGALVWVGDPTLFGARERGPVLVEHYLVDRPDDLWAPLEADATGSFRIDGLLDREYRVEAMDGRNLLRAELPGVRGGTHDVEVVLQRDGVFPLLSGRVVTSRGAGVANASVQLQCDALTVFLGEMELATSHGGGAEITTTDAEGRFELHDVPREHAYLRIEGEDMLPVEHGRDVEGGLAQLLGNAEELEIEASLRCHLQLELPVHHPATAFRVLDGAGVELPIDLFVGHGRETRTEFPIVRGAGGTTQVFAVPDSARTLALHGRGGELGRIGLALQPGTLNTVRP